MASPQAAMCMQLTRPHAVKTVKYVNPRGGTWTVAAQRVPAKADDDTDLPLVSLGLALLLT